MIELERFVIESANCQGVMEDLITDSSFQLNILKLNYRNDNFDELITKVAFLVNHCDAVLVEIDEKENKFNSSFRETYIVPN